MEKIFIHLNMYFDRGNLHGAGGRPLLTLTACSLLTTASNIHNQNTPSNDHLFSIIGSASIHGSLIKQQTYNLTGKSSDLCYISLNVSVCKNPRGFFNNLIHGVFFTKTRLGHALAGNMQCCHRAADKEKQNGVEENLNGRRIKLYFSRYYIIKACKKHKTSLK
jgi:hypothetical protein